MHTPIKFALITLSLFTTVASAQYEVTTSGGSNNTVPLFTGSTILGNSAITQLGGNVGIGTVTPGTTLDVNGSATIRTAGNAETWTMQPGHNGYGPSLRAFNTTGPTQAQIESSYLILNGETGGNVGIGETNPRTLLHVTVPGSNSLQWAQVLQNPGGTGVGVGLQFKASIYADGNPTENNKWSGIAGIADVGSSYDDFFGLSFYTHNGIAVPPSEVMRISSSGNVGIGTPAPTVALDVTGQIRSSTGGFIFPDGSVQTIAFNPANCGADYAESVDVTGDRTNYAPGDILVIDPKAPGKFLKSNQPYSTMVSGVYSTQPGFVGRLHPETAETKAVEVPMAMVGRVPTKVSAENGPIQVGDLLVSSSTLGYAMRGTDRSLMLGAVIGKALGSLESGTGVIQVLVTLQ